MHRLSRPRGWALRAWDVFGIVWRVCMRKYQRMERACISRRAPLIPVLDLVVSLLGYTSVFYPRSVQCKACTKLIVPFPCPFSINQARGSDLRVHFKNTREAAAAIRGKDLIKAREYLEAVLDHKRAIPFTRFNGGVGRTSQAKNEGNKIGQARWPKKSCEFLLNLLKNAESNAELKGLDTDVLFVSHIQVNQAPRGRRRTYRAHGRVNPYMSSPSHIELILSERTKVVAAEKEPTRPRKLSKVQAAKLLRSGAKSVSTA